MQGKMRMQSGANVSLKGEMEDLVQGAQRGEAESFAKLYETFYGKIHRYVFFKTGDSVEAEDITEEVFLRMLESIDSFKWRGHPFSAWLYRIAHNLVADHFRKRARQNTMALESLPEFAGNSSQDMERELGIKMTFARVTEAMMGLTELQREVLSLRFAGELSVLETAHVMGKKENAVKALQHAAIRKLRMLLEPIPYNPSRMPTPAAEGLGPK